MSNWAVLPTIYTTSKRLVNSLKTTLAVPSNANFVTYSLKNRVTP